MANLEEQDRKTAATTAKAIVDRAEIKSDLAIAHSELSVKLEAIKTTLEKLSDRVVVLEKDTWMRSGRAAAAVFVIGFLSWFVPWFFTGAKK